MNTYIIGLFDKSSDIPMDMPLLEFTVTAESPEAARETLFKDIIHLEIMELN
jgi:hypothetical protein